MRTLFIPVLLAMTVTAAAGPAHTLAEGGRYQLMEVNDRVVRLDTETGRFDLCRMESGAWSCTLASDEREALESRIAALAGRIEALEEARRADIMAAEAGHAEVATGAPMVLVQEKDDATAPRRVLRYITGLVPDLGW